MKPEPRSDSAKQILQVYMPSCPSEDLEKQILSILCPYLDQSIARIIDNIDEQLQVPKFLENLEETTFDDQFIELRNLLALWYEIISWIVSIGGPRPTGQVKSVLEYLPTSMIKICGHCKNKRKLYPHNSLPMVLQDVYRDACYIIKRYCTLFNRLRFSSTDSKELTTAILQLGNMATLTLFSVKSLINTWEAFGKFTMQEWIRLRDDAECIAIIRTHCITLGKDVLGLLKNIKAPPVEEFSNRLARINTLLDILWRLHYSAFKSTLPLNAEFIHEIVYFMILLKSHQELAESSHQGMSNDEDKPSKFFDWHESYQDLYKSSEHYVNDFTKRAQEMKTETDIDYKFGFHYCILDMKPLPIKMNFEVALNNINYIQKEIMEPRVLIPNWGTSVTGVIQCSLYEYTLTNLCTYFDYAESFINYESILFQHLLGDKFWSSLLSYDILNYCYKRSNKNLLFSHIQIFMEAYEALQTRHNNSVAVAMLGRLIIDIYRLLTPMKKEELLQHCTSSASILLILKSPSWTGPREKLLTFYKKLAHAESASNLPIIIAELRRQPTAKNWTRLTDLLTLMGIENSHDIIERTEDLLNICSLALNALDQVEDFKSRMINDLILILFDCARVKNKAYRTWTFNWPLLSTLVKGIIYKVQLPDEMLVRLCHYLKNNSDCLEDTGSDGQIAIISDLFCSLLESDSKEVHQEALEAFDHIVEVANEDAVRGISCAISRRPKLRETVPAYLAKKEIHKIKNINGKNWNFVKVLIKHSENITAQHKCYKNEERWRDEKAPRHENSLDEQANRLCQELKGLAQVKQSLSATAIGDLERVCNYFIEQK